MTVPPGYRLSEAEKDALLLEHAAAIEHMAARVAELKASVSKPKKTSANSHLPPSQSGPGGKGHKAKRGRKSRPSRPGLSRPLAENADRTERCLADACPHCPTTLSPSAQRCRHRYDYIDLPEVRPVVARVELFGGRCGQCGRRYRAEPPATMPPGTPFDLGLRSLLAYSHNSQHVGFERLSRLLKEVFRLTISEGAIANAFRCMGGAFDAARTTIKAKLLTAPVIASEETTTRVNGVTQWQWVFLSDTAVLHEIAPSRERGVAEQVLGDHQPEVWVSGRYAGQQELGRPHQICLAHVLSDVQYAIDCRDTVLAPKIRDHLRWAIRVGKRRLSLKNSTLAAYAAKANHRLDALVGVPATRPAGQTLQRHIKSWRGKFFVFLADRCFSPLTTSASGKSGHRLSSAQLRSWASIPAIALSSEPHGCKVSRLGVPLAPWSMTISPSIEPAASIP